MELRTEVLLQTITEQKNKIETYQTKLRDLVIAYKDLQKEKSALEASVNALSQSQSRAPLNTGNVQSSVGSRVGTASGTTRPLVHRPDSERAEERMNLEKLTQEGGDEIAEDVVNQHPDDGSDVLISGDGDVEDHQQEYGGDKEHEDNENMTALRDQLSTLTQSLATVTTQKSKMEASFMADKKKLKQEFEDRERLLEVERNDLQKQIQSLKADNEQVKNKLRSQQHVQDKVQEDYALMMRELQQIVSVERMAKEQLESQLDDVRAALVERQVVSQQKYELYEQTISGLHVELSTLQAEYETCKEKSVEPSSLLMHLQKELIDVKEAERRAQQHEARCEQEAQERVRSVAQTSERRIAELENRISEMSEMLGGAERLRGEDQRALHRLKERVIQLDLENSALTKIVHSSSSSSAEHDEQNLSLAGITEKIQRLVPLYEAASQREEHPRDLIDVLSLGDGENVHRKCDERYDSLRDEFEKYKLRAQSVLRSNKSATKDSGVTDREVSILRSQVSDLKERISSALNERDLLATRLNEKEAGFALSVNAMTESQRAELAQLDSVHRQKLSELEAEIRRHRERTVALLAEKDGEISVLRLQASTERPDRYQSVVDYRSSMGELSPGYQSNRQLSADEASGAAGSETSSSSAVNELLSRQGIMGVDQNPNTVGILHFANESGRRDVEISALRRQKHALEAGLRELNQSMVMKDSTWAERCDSLTEELRRAERNRSRESANMEYLKNVVYRYMCGVAGSDGVGGRQQMLNAIATILAFSPHEKSQVQAVLNKGWWAGSSKS